MRASISCWQELDSAEGTQPLQAYAIANLGGIRAIIVSATVCLTAAGLS